MTTQVSFDSLSHIRILDAQKYDDTEKLQENMQKFSDSMSLVLCYESRTNNQEVTTLSATILQIKEALEKKQEEVEQAKNWVCFA